MEIKQVFQPKQKYALENRPMSKLIGRVKLADFMQLPENEFGQFIQTLENNPLFKRLMYPDKKEEKVIRYKSFYGAGLSKKIYELKEEVIADKNSFDVQQLLSNKKEVVEIIRKLGIDKFKQYFLHNESNMTHEQIGALCGLEVKEVRSINALIDGLSINTALYYPSHISSPKTSYCKIASIEKNRTGELVIGYFSPRLAKGRYVINYEKFKLFKTKGFFSDQEITRIDRLLKQIEVVNSRKTTIHSVIKNVIKHQQQYLKSGAIEKLAPFSQRKCALEITINPSLVCRAIYGRTIDVPWREEMPLKRFFPSNKDIRKNLIKKIILTENQPYSDAEIKNLLKKWYNIAVSAHVVTICRNELKIPSAGKRKTG